ncbi:hypothetical protein CDL15_Pgr005663 [Punica granatum]|uniref:C3H1-type domain-containing protein n=1 Tax=Punica granatum TaxID=22663 RepID=A0A218WFP2_PUNGR|nr:hypothetical protein CDL15_Pgr005663 [Punica granatum]
MRKAMASFEFSPSLSLEEQAIIAAFRSPFLDSEKVQTLIRKLDSEKEQALMKQLQGITVGETNGSSSSIRSVQGAELPLRPYKKDCPFFLRTRMCMYGSSCELNHSPPRTNQEGADNEEHLQRTKKVECKYYYSSRGCKFGEACRYSHIWIGQHVKMEQPDLESNLLVPMTQGPKQCPSYMACGFYTYGPNCRLQHPEPVVTGDGSHYGSNSSENLSGLGTKYYQVTGTGDPKVSQYEVSSQQCLHTRLPPRRYDHGSHNAPRNQWCKKKGGQHGSLSIDRSLIRADIFPERPGQPECPHHIKTGDCKYKSLCRFHHPKIQALSATSCAMNIGNPIFNFMQERKLCPSYELCGICPSGSACRFDHPKEIELYGTVPNAAANYGL